jgi:hypothetical protein
MNQRTPPGTISDALAVAERAARDRIVQAVTDTFRDFQSTVRQLAPAENERWSAKLNDHLTRMRAAENDRGWCDALLYAVSQFCRRSAFFAIRRDQLWFQGSRGIAAETDPPPVDIVAAPAFANAVSRSSVTRAGRTAQDLSTPIAALTGERDEASVDLIPIALPDRVAGVLYTEGAANLDALELIANFAACSLECRLLLEQGAAGRRFRVRTSTGPASPRNAAARRFARVAVAGIVLHEFDAVRRGRLERSIYSSCAASIDAARGKYRENYAGLPDYLHQEIVRTLASNQPELLGTNYPHARS